MKKPFPIGAIIFGVLLCAFTTYVMLDMFVIVRPMQTNATEMNLALFENVATPTDTPTPTPVTVKDPDATPTPEVTSTPTPTPTPSMFSEKVVSTDTFYSNDHMAIQISEYREHNTQIHVAEVWVSSPQYIYTAFAQDAFGRNVYDTTSNMAKAKGAVFAINGDNYGSREGGYVIRNGILYRSKKYQQTSRDVLCLMANGEFVFSSCYLATADDLLELGTWQAWTFGPVLVDDYEIKVDVNSEVDLCFVTNPRTAIGLIEPLHYVFLVADGRTEKSHGLSLYQVADFMKRYGCKDVYNLDGGGSSTMVFQGKIINFPTSYGSWYEKEVTDIVYMR